MVIQEISTKKGLASQSILWHFRERGQIANLDRRLHLCVDCHSEKAVTYPGFALRNSTNLEPYNVRENAIRSTACASSTGHESTEFRQPVDLVQLTLGH